MHEPKGEITTIKTGDRLISARVSLPSPSVPIHALAICLHGFPDNYDSFHQQIEPLSKAGYLIVCPSLPGYDVGHQLPNRHYDMAHVSEAIIEMIIAIKEHFGVENLPTHLIGHDWGGISGFAAVATAPSLFHSFTSLTIPYNLSLGNVLKKGLTYLPYSWYIQLFQIPGIAEQIVKVADGKFIDKLYAQWSPDWKVPAEQLASVKRTLFYKDTLSHALAYYRALYSLNPSAQKGRQLLNDQISVPTMMIRGENDGCIYRSLWNTLDSKSFTQEIAIEVVNTGHFPHQEAPKEINHLLISWMDRHNRDT